MRPPLFPSLLLAACSNDYELAGEAIHDDATEEEGTEGPIGDEDLAGICPSLEGEPHAVPLNTECDVDLQEGSFTPVVEWDHGNSTFCGPPGIGQIVDSNGSGALDAEDLPAILLYQGGLSGFSYGRVVALKGDGSGTYWESANGIGQDGGFAIGDLDNDGWPEVVAVNASNVFALDGRTGTTKWTSPNISRSLDPSGFNYPAIADMEGDGAVEVTVGNVILRGKDGKIKGQGTKGKGAAVYYQRTDTYGTLSVPVDLDNDGQMELVTGNAAYNPDGSIKWENSGLDGLIAVADFDGDGEGEIVKTSGAYVTYMETDGREIWTKNYSPRNDYLSIGAAAIDDLDDDGEPEIVFAAANKVVALDRDGNEKWSAPVVDASGAAGPVLFDFELDGYPEVLYADEESIQFFSGVDGSNKYKSTKHKSYTILETPVVADVDNDDQVEIVLGHCGDGFSNFSALTVYGDADSSWPPGRKIWNQHAYQITNVGELGEIGGPMNNFADYNSFRSGDVGRPPGEYIDLQAEIWDICLDECSDQSVAIGAWVLNAGNLEAPAGIPVSLRAGAKGKVVATQYTTVAIAPGTTGEMMVFELDPAELLGKEPVIAADYDEAGAGVVFECDEKNNAYGGGDPVCE